MPYRCMNCQTFVDSTNSRSGSWTTSSMSSRVSIRCLWRTFPIVLGHLESRTGSPPRYFSPERPPLSTMAAIRTEDLTKRYGDVVGIEDVSLTVEEGEV